MGNELNGDDPEIPVDDMIKALWNEILADPEQHYLVAEVDGKLVSSCVLVVIKSDGSLETMRILESSGHPVLDRAALNIVRTAAPFAPFTGELAANYDQVEIIRTWRFERGDRLSSQ